ncbi:hypothetical protein HHX48_06480 [Salinimonas sp. HHU 13199]|uniref:Flagellar assembly protein T N-terminal domain-containing protein n=1 Tax=Salinimonas profundi TaxID=2729140 RepID=A0ABR8LLX9_9ALTE|nr:flagellar assembly protein T N-terminal domain-containing protein [Salinimonas profundi]MBD3585372.1 hypothetical protein [Salinimonas profundi]
MTSLISMLCTLTFLRPGYYSRAIVAILSMSVLCPWQVSAAWFEAQGQALVIEGDKEAAKQEATQEALRQAMLFAGASVQSVQTLANGLLKKEQLTVTANGEVQNVELIDEIWEQDIVTVRIRADIFPKPASCEAAGFLKTIATTEFLIATPAQAQDGQIQELSSVIPRKLQTSLAHQTNAATIAQITDYPIDWRKQNLRRQAPTLARQSRTQYVIAATITDLSLTRKQASMLSFWKGEQATRHFSLDISLIDGVHGGVLMQKQYRDRAPWHFDRFEDIDASGAPFWQSAYGEAINNTLQQISSDVAAKLACQPATGRVIQVAGNSLEVSLGRSHGIEVGDELFLYQTKQISNPFNDNFIQYNLYPEKVTVTAAYADSATVTVANDGILMNIQPNDFVAKR